MLFKIQNTNKELLLWRKNLAGDENAYTYIYRKYIEELFSCGMRFTPDKELVKDCVQDIFIKIYNNRSNLGATDNIRRKRKRFVKYKNASLLFNVKE